MNILLISKYAKTSSSSRPGRQFLLSKALVNKGHNVMLAYSRSNGISNDKFKGSFKCVNEEGVNTMMMNGPLVELGMNFLRIWSWIIFEFRLFRNKKKLAQFEPDIIIVSSLSILTFLFGTYLKKRINKPYIVEVRDLYPLTLLEVGNFFKYNPFVIFLSWIEKYGYKNADAIVSTLENTKKYFIKRIKKDVNFYWLPIGFDESLYVNEAGKESLIIIDKIKRLKQQGKFIVGYAGSIGTANGLDNILEVAIDNEIINSNIDFVFIGNGPKKEYYKKKFNTDNIHFFNSIEKKYVPLVLSECHILVNFWLDRNIYKYGVSPNKWIDYMYSARPVLLSLNANSKIFDEGGFGWQIPAQNKEKIKNEIVRIASLSNSTLDIIGFRGKTYLYENLKYKKLAEKLEYVINECIQKYNLTNQIN